MLHVPRAPRQHEVQVCAHDCEAGHRALDQKPVIGPGVCSTEKLLHYIVLHFISNWSPHYKMQE
jgi:hypothetical protein